jgi:type II secretory pathway pseudopilin PulG
VLVALIIFAIAFGAIASIFQTSLRQSTTAEALLEATALAERQIARYGTELPLVLGATTGISPEGLSWSTEIGLARPAAETGAPALYRITVKVGAADGVRRPVTLETLRIGHAP